MWSSYSSARISPVPIKPRRRRPPSGFAAAGSRVANRPSDSRSPSPFARATTATFAGSGDGDPNCPGSRAPPPSLLLLRLLVLPVRKQYRPSIIDELPLPSTPPPPLPSLFDCCVCFHARGGSPIRKFCVGGWTIPLLSPSDRPAPPPPSRRKARTDYDASSLAVVTRRSTSDMSAPHTGQKIAPRTRESRVGARAGRPGTGTPRTLTWPRPRSRSPHPPPQACRGVSRHSS